MRIRMLECSLVAALLCVLLAGPALAQGRDGGRGVKKTAAPAAVTADVKFGFGAHERAIITTYYTPRTSGLPPGLAKRDAALPPGLEKQLRRNWTLPRDVQNRIEPLPVVLERQLPSLPLAYRRGTVGGHVVVYRPDTHVVVDVMLNIAR